MVPPISSNNQNLQDHAIQNLIKNKKLSIEQANNLTKIQKNAISVTADLILGNVININKILRLSNIQCLNLYNNLNDSFDLYSIKNQLKLGKKTIEELTVPIINKEQSTHEKSVEKSISEVAIRLSKNYHARVEEIGLENIINRIKSDVNKLSNSIKNKAAKRCISRITSPENKFTDPVSKITTKLLLALTFMAIHDETKRFGTYEDAFEQFIEGLYEIQRGGNLDHKGLELDQGATTDQIICGAGTFNKLVEKLQGTHKDSEIRLITKATASLKLPIIVREETVRYLETLVVNSTNNADILQLITQIKERGVEVIWDDIKKAISSRMFDEFGNIYENKDCSFDALSFDALIEAGQDTDLDDLINTFEEQITAHKGPHQCQIERKKTFKEEPVTQQKKSVILPMKVKESIATIKAATSRQPEKSPIIAKKPSNSSIKIKPLTVQKSWNSRDTKPMIPSKPKELRSKISQAAVISPTQIKKSIIRSQPEIQIVRSEKLIKQERQKTSSLQRKPTTIVDNAAIFKRPEKPPIAPKPVARPRTSIKQKEWPPIQKPRTKFNVITPLKEPVKKSPVSSKPATLTLLKSAAPPRESSVIVPSSQEQIKTGFVFHRPNFSNAFKDKLNIFNQWSESQNKKQEPPLPLDTRGVGVKRK